MAIVEVLGETRVLVRNSAEMQMVLGGATGKLRRVECQNGGRQLCQENVGFKVTSLPIDGRFGESGGSKGIPLKLEQAGRCIRDVSQADGLD